MPTTATYVVTTTAIGAEKYRAVIEITDTTNALDRELFVFDTIGGAFASVATRYTLETAPIGQQAAIDGQAPYFRESSVLREFSSVEGAEAFVEQSLARLGALCRSIDKVAFPFGGSMTGTVPPI